MPLSEDAGAIGPISKEWYRYLMSHDGTKISESSGSSVQEVNRDAGALFDGIQVDELVGKIGPEVTAYDPEADNRLIQEF
jgi:hypothetical protein